MDRWRALAEPYRSAAQVALQRIAARAELSADPAKSSRGRWRTDADNPPQS
jgi:hypothetical protein